jgi:hypothetical protein
MIGKRNIARLGTIGSVIAGLGIAVVPVSAQAQTATATNDPIKQLQNEIRKIQKQYQTQIQSLQKQLDYLKAAQAAPPHAPPPALGAPAPLAIPLTAGALPPPVPGGPGAPPPPTGEAVAKRGGIFGTGIDVSLANTYIEAASIFRTRNETADISSNFNTGIPMPNNPNYHLSEFRESAHQSRLALLAQGSVNEDTKLAGYFESDFQSAATTSNSVESNSYNPRLRLAYATLDKRNWGTSILGGQGWSLLTICLKRT